MYRGGSYDSFGKFEMMLGIMRVNLSSTMTSHSWAPSGTSNAPLLLLFFLLLLQIDRKYSSNCLTLIFFSVLGDLEGTNYALGCYSEAEEQQLHCTRGWRRRVEYIYGHADPSNFKRYFLLIFFY